MNTPHTAPSKAWQARAVPMLGLRADVDIAKELGVTPRQVRYLRLALGKQPAHRQRWSLPLLQKLGTVPDAVLAAELGLSESSIKRKRQQLEAPFERRGIPPQAAPLLGKVPDMQVALMFGRSYETARRWRIAAQLPPVVVSRPWQAQELAKLGTMPDKVLARELARRTRDVRGKRERLGIPEHAA